MTTRWAPYYDVRDLPQETRPRPPSLHDLIDAVSNKDDEIAKMVLEEKPVTPPVLKAAIRRLTRD